MNRETNRQTEGQTGRYSDTFCILQDINPFETTAQKHNFVIFCLKMAFRASLWPLHSPRVSRMGQLFILIPLMINWPTIVMNDSLKNVLALGPKSQMMHYLTLSDLKLTFLTIFQPHLSWGSP